jgi:hypothetical protein
MTSHAPDMGEPAADLHHICSERNRQGGVAHYIESTMIFFTGGK